MPYDFDIPLDRSRSSSTKWSKFPSDVLPMWVADMDFAAPGFIGDVLAERLSHPILGYTDRPDSLNEAFMSWLSHHFDWQVPSEWLVWLPGVVPGLNLAAQTLSSGQLIVPTPVYYPFLDLAHHANLQESLVPMVSQRTSKGMRWEMDLDDLAQVAGRFKGDQMMLICNPQNPTGRCYSTTELACLGELVERHDLILVSDEIHCNLVLDDDVQHTPFVKACPDVAASTITLFAATKAYNIPGVSCAVAVIPDDELRAKFVATRRGLISGIGPLGFVASEAAFNDRGDWLPSLRSYLKSNLQLLQAQLGDRLAQLEGTYLAWIDVSDLEIADTESYFAQFGVGVSPGSLFGEPSHVRLNFGCPEQTLNLGLQRLLEGIAARS